MKSSITALFTLFFFLVGSANAASVDFSANSLKSIQSDMICADKKKKEEEEEAEPECD